jgi:2-oxo-4-hydroxy-4-carboxy--5-ureidoimidazoline (OHCU) decarboxylase
MKFFNIYEISPWILSKYCLQNPKPTFENLKKFLFENFKVDISEE